MKVTKICPVCGVEFQVNPSQAAKRSRCSMQCRSIATGYTLNPEKAKPPRTKKLDNDKQAVIDLYLSGKTLAEVAEAFGVAHKTVWLYLKNNDIERRTPASYPEKLQWDEGRKQQHSNALRGKPSGTKGKTWKITHRVVKPNLRGSRNPSWRGGFTPVNLIVRGSAPYKAWRLSVFKRDNFACVQCGEQGKGELQADHIVPFSVLMRNHSIRTLEEAEACAELWDIANGRTLCKKCHKATGTWGLNLVHGQKHSCS